MPDPTASDSLPEFSHLEPDVVLHLVEAALGRRASNLCRPLTSYINRVYDIRLEDGDWVVAKFYRPGRWSRDALQDELDFVRELAEAEIPVIPPLPGPNGNLLHEHHGMYFAVLPKIGGRPLEEPAGDQWRELGRLLGRMHKVGEQRRPRDRIVLHPDHATHAHVETILNLDFPMPSLRDRFEELCEDLFDEILPRFEDIDLIRIHGDCHRANILCRPGEPFRLIDFDDMAVGPAAQDLWMMLPDHLRLCPREFDLLLEGYETFRWFDPRERALIEPLRAMRFLHYTAWCARQARDGGFARLAPDFGTAAFWRQEIDDLARQIEEIRDDRAFRGGRA